MSPDSEVIRKRLATIYWVAWADLALLVVLLFGSLTNNEDIVHIFGPIHGIGFLIGLALVVRGAAEGLWGWWYPAITFITTGPPGAIYGHYRILKKLDAPKVAGAA